MQYLVVGDRGINIITGQST